MTDAELWLEVMGWITPEEYLSLVDGWGISLEDALTETLEQWRGTYDVPADLTTEQLTVVLMRHLKEVTPC